MKKIEAYIQPFMLRKVEESLRAIHIHGMSVIEAKGFGREKDESFPHHVVDSVIDFTPKTKVEIVCIDQDCAKIVEAIQNSAHTGRKGDGKIFVFEVLETTSILTGQKGEKAI